MDHEIAHTHFITHLTANLLCGKRSMRRHNSGLIENCNKKTIMHTIPTLE